MALNPYKKATSHEQAQSSRDTMIHNHVFLTMADTANGHQHILLGTTSQSIPKKDIHVHRICKRITQMTNFQRKTKAPTQRQEPVSHFSINQANPALPIR